MLELLENQKSLTINQWKIFTACFFTLALDFFDFFLISFVLAFFMRDWNLTYGQSALVLISSGVASVPAAFFFGWLGDKIGRRKVFMMTVLIFSLATGLMALTPERGWIYLTVMRFIVGLGVGGFFAVDMPLLQEFVPASRRGWISGASMSLLPAGPMAAAAFTGWLGPIIGWRGLFLLGALPALMAFVIRVWVPESPRWLIGRGRFEEARRSLAWALQLDPKDISLPAELAAPRQTSWLELFKYPRSIAASCLTSLSQTGVVGLTLWMAPLFVLVLNVSPADAAFMTIWYNALAIVGRFFSAWLSDALGRRWSGILICLATALTMSLAGYLHDFYLGTVSLFYALILINGFFGPGTYAIIGPYMTEVWPASLRASGLGLAYGVGNIGKFIGPAGLALIAGASNYMNPQATLPALVPGFNYFAVWYVVAALVFFFIAIETRGRTIEELDAAFSGGAASPATVKIPAQ
jgi:putative MFS transporter